MVRGLKSVIASPFFPIPSYSMLFHASLGFYVVVTIHVDHPPSIGQVCFSSKTLRAKTRPRPSNAYAAATSEVFLGDCWGLGEAETKKGRCWDWWSSEPKESKREVHLWSKNMALCSCFGSTLFFGGLTVENHRRNHFPYLHLRFQSGNWIKGRCTGKHHRVMATMVLYIMVFKCFHGENHCKSFQMAGESLGATCHAFGCPGYDYWWCCRDGHLDRQGSDASKFAGWNMRDLQYLHSHRIHGAGIYANIYGVYWWDPCYHIYIYSSTMDPI